MKTRILTSLGMAVIGIPILIFSKYIVFAITVAVLSFVAVFEMFRAVGIQKKYFISVPAYVLAPAFPFASYFLAAEHTFGYLLLCVAGLFVYLIYSFFVAVFMRGELKFSEVSEAFCLATYVIFSFTSITFMRYMNVKTGLWSFVLVLISAWGSDVFAYFTGRFFGRHKLIPEVSPKKTVEGSIGGIVCATGLAVLYGFIVSRCTALVPDYLVLAISAFVLSAVSQVGDLIASLIKREHGIKDYGNIFPGHGGVMDRFDSVLSITTVLMIICLVFPPFT
ncbi:MAG: hypothetical protein E7612_02370 [Ruminococcaceae bacterium]|nr:hypothetical protein [Oscillospiraceae bacterium]